MTVIKKVGIGLGALVALVVAGGVGTLAWAKSAATTRLAAKHAAHTADFPIPFPLSEVELAALRAERTTPETPEGADVLAGVDLGALATERAVARGKYLVESRYPCGECHGANFGGGTMIDDPAIGVLKGKNLTRGQGGVVANYTATDWDRMVRHGIKPDGTATVMPSVDFLAMSDRELSDVVAYIGSLPPVDATVPDVEMGPLGAVLVATGQLRLTAEFADHQKQHLLVAPKEDTPEFGAHLAQVCAGCHNPELTGGPIAGGPPDWPPARNLTPHADGLAGWTYDDFKRAMLEAKGKDGTPLREPMASMPKFAKNMTETDLEAMWKHLASLAPKPTPKP